MKRMKGNTIALMVASALAASVAPGTASAAGEVVFGCWGGASQARFQERMLPPFEKEHNVTVRYVPGVSTYFTSQMQAQRNAPELDVVCQDDGPQSVARELGLLAPVDETIVPNLSNVVAAARGAENVGVGY